MTSFLLGDHRHSFLTIHHRGNYLPPIPRAMLVISWAMAGCWLSPQASLCSCEVSFPFTHLGPGASLPIRLPKNGYSRGMSPFPPCPLGVHRSNYLIQSGCAMISKPGSFVELLSVYFVDCLGASTLRVRLRALAGQATRPCPASLAWATR